MESQQKESTEKHCKNCNSQNELTLTNQLDFRPTVSLFIITAGPFVFSFRDISILLGRKKHATILNCTNCNVITIECPHCGEFHNADEGKKEECKHCSKQFYIWT